MSYSRFQSFIILVQPGKQPTTDVEKQMVTYSGNVRHTIPNDREKDLQEFNVVMLYNGYTHYTPTYIEDPSEMQTWRLAIAHSHVKAAIDQFDQIESNIPMDESLPQAYQDLREALMTCDMLSGAQTRSKMASIPSIFMGPTKAQAARTSCRTVPTSTPALPFIDFNVPLTIVNPTTIPSVTQMEVSHQMQTRSAKSARGSAPGKATTTVTSTLNRPIASSRRQITPIPPVTVTPSTQQRKKPSATVTSPSVTVSIPLPPRTTSSTTTTTASQPVPVGPPVPSGQKKFTCSLCNYQTERKNDLHNHMHTHSGYRVKCPHFKQCGKKFTTQKAMKLHVKTKHHKIPRYTCDFAPEGCDFTTNDYGKVAPHLKKVHDIGTMDFKCPNPQCKNKQFDNALVYQRHMRTFHLPRDEQCLLCKRWYKSGDYFNNHLTDSHSGAQFLCHLCGQVFPNYNSLKVHMSNAHRDQ